MEDQSQKQIEQTKNLIIQKIAELDISEDFLLSEFLSDKMHRDYSSISKLFHKTKVARWSNFSSFKKLKK
ncbi:hypothetical protein LDL59_09675 [Kaistella anthropi]|nr:hypothetical protein [Kaistella anthropi]